MEQTDEKLLYTIITAIVDNPDAVKIERTLDEQGVLLLLRVHKNDMGKVIGKTGKTAEAVRLILRVEGMKHSSRVSVKLLEPPVPHTHHVGDTTIAD